jgi:hypothetical protein
MFVNKQKGLDVVRREIILYIWARRKFELGKSSALSYVFPNPNSCNISELKMQPKLIFLIIFLDDL